MDEAASQDGALVVPADLLSRGKGFKAALHGCEETSKGGVGIVEILFVVDLAQEPVERGLDFLLAIVEQGAEAAAQSGVGLAKDEDRSARQIERHAEGRATLFEIELVLRSCNLFSELQRLELLLVKIGFLKREFVRHVEFLSSVNYTCLQENLGALCFVFCLLGFVSRAAFSGVDSA